MKKIILIITLMLYAVPSWSEQYIFGVVPQQSPVKLHKKWKPFVDYLSKETGHEIILKTEKSIAEFEKVLYDGGYDFAYMNPYHYVVANRTMFYEAKIRADKMIRGILVSRGNSLTSLLEKKDAQFLFPSPNAFAATLLLKYELLTKFDTDLNKLDNYQYVNSHDSVYKGVARGVGDLGGGIQRTFTNLDVQSDKDKLEVIYRTKAYPSHPIAFKKEMDEELQNKLTDILLNLPKELSNNLSIKKFITTSNEEYDEIRDLEKKLAIVERK